MFSLQRSLIAAVASVPLFVVAIGEAGSQTASAAVPKTIAEMARVIAQAIDASKRPDLPIVLESATSHDNVVELHYKANDARLFPRDAAERERRRLESLGRFCFSPQISLFRKNGVAIHKVLTGPDDSEVFEFTIDQSTCAALIAEAKTRADAAERELKSIRSGTGSPTEPRHVHTFTVRPDQAK